MREKRNPQQSRPKVKTSLTVMKPRQADGIYQELQQSPNPHLPYHLTIPDLLDSRGPGGDQEEPEILRNDGKGSI